MLKYLSVDQRLLAGVLLQLADHGALDHLVLKELLALQVLLLLKEALNHPLAHDGLLRGPVLKLALDGGLHLPLKELLALHGLLDVLLLVHKVRDESLLWKQDRD